MAPSSYVAGQQGVTGFKFFIVLMLKMPLNNQVRHKEIWFSVSYSSVLTFAKLGKDDEKLFVILSSLEPETSSKSPPFRGPLSVASKTEEPKSFLTFLSVTVALLCAEMEQNCIYGSEFVLEHSCRLRDLAALFIFHISCAHT